LLQLKSTDETVKKVMLADLLEITELGMTIAFYLAVDVSKFYNLLKKAVSDFNADATLFDKELIDFDDLYTKYSEYVEVLKMFI